MTNLLRSKWDPTVDGLCAFSNNKWEPMVHLFWFCGNTRNFWNILIKWLSFLSQLNTIILASIIKNGTIYLLMNHLTQQRTLLTIISTNYLHADNFRKKITFCFPNVTKISDFYFVVHLIIRVTCICTPSLNKWIIIFQKQINKINKQC